MILLPIYDEWPHAEWRHSPIGFSPDGSKVAFYAGTWPQETQRYVVVYNIETDEVTRNTVGFDFPSIEPREGDSHYTFPYIRVGEKYLISNVFSDLFSDENIPNNRTHAILDETTGEIDIFPRLTDGTTPNNTISSITVSPNGRLVAFSSYASNLVPGDTNGWPDVFVQDMDTGKIVRVSVAEDGREANLSSNNPVFSPDGTRLMFSSYASNLVPNDRNGTLDIFIVTLSELVSPIGLGRTEAETLKLPTGFFVEASVLASGGEWIRSGVNVENVASGAFDGPAGLYAITVGYMDETDGESAMAIRVNGVEVDAWVWDGDYGDAIATAAGRSRHAVFGVELAPGDAITFVGRGDGGEPLRTDWIEIAPTPLVGLGRTEAEDLAQVGFFVGTNPHASGGSWLQAEGDREARAAFVFDGEAGLHDLSIGYFDESDGASMMKIAVNGEIVHAWAWDADGGAAIAEPSSRAEHVAAGLDLAPGDLVELIGQADGGEPLRTDWIEIAPLAVWADPVDALMG